MTARCAATAALSSIAILAAAASAQTVADAPMRWHDVSVTFAGPEVRETAAENPFLNYRMEVVFTHEPTGEQIVAPGYWAADGQAGATGAAAGDQWRAHLLAHRTGRWSYEARFEHGENVAVAERFGTGRTQFDGSFHGQGGAFDVVESDKMGRDFRAPDRGLLRNRGGHYLTFANGRAWIKGGPNIPENLLGYYGFDNTASQGRRGPDYPDVPDAERRLHRYRPHRADCNGDDPDWNRNDGPAETRDHAGRNIVGAINYVASTGANSLYFLPNNVGGDGRDTYPTIAPDERTRYDVSKLDQWATLFEHAQSRGVFLHFVLAETESENENYHDDGQLGPQRRLFYRELVARFGHLPGLQWNLGEENDYSSRQRRAFAGCIKAVDPYDHPIASHTHTNRFDSYEPLLGDDNIDMTSFQTDWSKDRLGDEIEQWRRRSQQAGAPLAVSVDEPQQIDNDRDDRSRGLPSVRRRFLWPAYLSGAAGFEMYVQKDGGGHGLDQAIEDFRQLEPALVDIGHALAFMDRLPVTEMTPDDDLLRGESEADGGGQILARAGQIYAFYMPDASAEGAEIDLRDAPGQTFYLTWYDPRTGQWVGEPVELQGGAWRALGPAPGDDDWAGVVTTRPF